jgi:hypothetical protein
LEEASRQEEAVNQSTPPWPPSEIRDATTSRLCPFRVHDPTPEYRSNVENLRYDGARPPDAADGTETYLNRT